MMLRLSHNRVIVLDRRRTNLALLSMGLASSIPATTERELFERWTSVGASILERRKQRSHSDPRFQRSPL